jgi:hypothetical protein
MSPRPPMITHAEELNALVSALVPFVQYVIQEHGAFLPLGAIVTSGDVMIAEAGFDDPQASVYQRVEMVQAALRDHASDPACGAVAYCVDTKVTNLKTGDVTDAVQLVFEHRSGEALDVFFPYEKTGDGVTFAQPMVRLAAGGLFPALPDVMVD